MGTTVVGNIASIIFSFGLFFAGIVGLSQYTSSYSSGREKVKISQKSGIITFF